MFTHARISTPSGRLSQEDLVKVFKEIKCKLGMVEVRHLVGWWDIGAEGIIRYRDLVHAIFARDTEPSYNSSNDILALATARNNSKAGVKKGRGGGGLNFKSDELTARAKRAGVLAEKAQIERRIKDLMRKEKMLSKKV